MARFAVTKGGTEGQPLEPGSQRTALQASQKGQTIGAGVCVCVDILTS